MFKTSGVPKNRRDRSF